MPAALDRFRLPAVGASAARRARRSRRSSAFENIVQTLRRDPRSLDGVSLTIEPGELVCLLGHSGCGKTTLLRVAAGRRDAELGAGPDGRREVERPRPLRSARAARHRPDVPGLRPVPAHERSAERDVRAARPVRQEADIAARRALSRVGLERYADEYPHTLSGGEQQRVALARSIAPRPGVLLMDEPFSNLDRRMRDAVRDETVAILRETGATTIVVTHDPEEAMRIADRIVLMRAGRIVQQGPCGGALSAPGRSLRGALLLRFQRGRGRGAKRPGRRRPLGVFRGARPRRTARAPSSASARRACALKPAGFCLPGPDRLAPLPRRGRSRPCRRAGPRPAACRPGSAIRDASGGQDVGIDIEPKEVLVFAASHP